MNTNQASDSFGWDDAVETADGGNFSLLDEGPAMFKVTEFKRGRFEGSKRMAACYQAELVLEVRDASGNVSDVRCNLPLNRRMAWKLTSFFKSVGLIDPGTPSGTTVRYEWDRLVGTRGICEIEHYTWTGDDGQVRTGNSIKSFLFGDRADEAAHGFGQPARPAQSPTPQGLAAATTAQRPYGGTF